MGVTPNPGPHPREGPGQAAGEGAAAQRPPSSHLLLMKPNVTGSLASLDGVAQHSVSTTLRLLCRSNSPTWILTSSLADTL